MHLSINKVDKADMVMACSSLPLAKSKKIVDGWYLLYALEVIASFNYHSSMSTTDYC